MTEEDTRLIENTIKAVIKETVNGKIDRLTLKVDEHIEQHKKDMEEHKKDMDELRPYIQAKGSLGILYKGILGAGGIALAWGAIKGFFPGL